MTNLADFIFKIIRKIKRKRKKVENDFFQNNIKNSKEKIFKLFTR